MVWLGCESHEALTSPQPQTREKCNSVELRLFEAQMFRTRKINYMTTLSLPYNLGIDL